jgi:hypothetical protein
MKIAHFYWWSEAKNMPEARSELNSESNEKN